MSTLANLKGLSVTEETASTRGSDEEVSFGYQTASSIDDIRAAYADASERLGKEFDADEILVGLFNAAQKSSASNPVRAAMRDGEDIDSARESALSTLVHTGRTASGGGRRGDVTAGLNKTRQKEFGMAFTQRIAEKGGMLTKAEIESLAAEFGLDPSDV